MLVRQIHRVGPVRTFYRDHRRLTVLAHPLILRPAVHGVTPGRFDISVAAVARKASNGSIDLLGAPKPSRSRPVPSGVPPSGFPSSREGSPASEASIPTPRRRAPQRRVRDAPQHHHRGAVSILGFGCRAIVFPESYLDPRHISVKSLRKWVSNPLVSEERSRGGARLRMGNGKLVSWQESSRLAGGLGVIFRRRCHGRVCEGAGRVN